MDTNRATMMAKHLGRAYKTDPAGYERTCRRYGEFFRHNYLPHLPVNKEAAILDVGCGLGHFLQFCRNEGYAGTQGIDLSDEHVAFCRAQGLNVEKADAVEFLGTGRRRFDAIVMNDVIEHVPKERVFTFLEAVFAALSPGGSVVLKTVNMANPIMGAHSRYLDFTHETGWTQESMQQVLEHAGFTDIQVLPSNLYVFWRHPLNYVAWLASKLFELCFRLYFRLNNRWGTTVFTKFIIAKARRPVDT